MKQQIKIIIQNPDKDTLPQTVKYKPVKSKNKLFKPKEKRIINRNKPNFIL